MGAANVSIDSKDIRQLTSTPAIHSLIRDCLPYLRENYRIAQKDVTCGLLGQRALVIIKKRLESASGLDADRSVDAHTVLERFSRCIIDLNGLNKDTSPAGLSALLAKVQAVYGEYGFTQLDPIFRFPVQPAM